MSSQHFYPVSSESSSPSHNPTHSLSDVFSALRFSLLTILFTLTQSNSFTFICLLNTSIQSSPHSINFRATQLNHFQMSSSEAIQSPHHFLNFPVTQVINFQMICHRFCPVVSGPS